MTIGIIVNEVKDQGFAVARKLAGGINLRGGKAAVTSGAALKSTGGFIYELNGMVTESRMEFSHCDVIICIGGDGTLIKVARESLFFDKPILGVNLGSLGYLTEVEINQIDAMLDRIFNSDYRIEDRMMLTITRESANYKSDRNAAANARYEETALNELVIGRGDSPHVVRLKIYINGDFLDVYPGDGILISTPTGSTAYSLSAGGPIIDPELNVISIVPICPHVIFSRPVLIAPDKVISVVPVSANGSFKASVSIDGFNGPELRFDEVIKIRKSEHVTKMLRLDSDNFYVALKNKLFSTTYKFGPEAEYRGIQ